MALYMSGGKIVKRGSGMLSTSGGGGGSPSWYTAMTSGQWNQISGSNFNASGVKESTALGNLSGSNHLFDSFCGGTLITGTGKFYSGATAINGESLMCFFGGHNGNDLNANYIFGNLLSNSPQWYRPRDSQPTSPVLNSIRTITSTLSAGLSAGATTATLASSWASASGTYYLAFSDGEVRSVTLSNGSTTINGGSSWGTGLTNAVTTSCFAFPAANVVSLTTGLTTGTTSYTLSSSWTGLTGSWACTMPNLDQTCMNVTNGSTTVTLNNAPSSNCDGFLDYYQPFDSSVNPVAFQSYQAAQYVESLNKVIYIGMCAMSRGADDQNCLFEYNLNTSSPNSNQPWSLGSYPAMGGRPNGCDCTAFEVSSGRIYYHKHQTTECGYYDINANTVTATSKSPGWSHEAIMACDQNRGILCVTASAPLESNTFVINFHRTSTWGSSDFYVPSTTGTAPTPAGGGPTWAAPVVVWNQDLDCFIVWWGGQTIYKLTPPASSPYDGGNPWAWSTLPTGGVTPATPNPAGVNGRFQYIHNSLIRGYITVNTNSDDVYFYKV